MKEVKDDKNYEMVLWSESVAVRSVVNNCTDFDGRSRGNQYMGVAGSNGATYYCR